MSVGVSPSEQTGTPEWRRRPSLSFQDLLQPQKSSPLGRARGRSPLVVRQLLLQQKHFGLEFVPLVEHVPQLLQCEPGAVGVLEIHGHLFRLRDALLPARLCLEEAEMPLMNSWRPPGSSHSTSCQSPNFPPSWGLCSYFRNLQAACAHVQCSQRPSGDESRRPPVHCSPSQ